MLIIAVRVIGWAGNFPGSRLEGEGGECGVMVMHRWPCPSMTGHLHSDRNTDRNEGPYLYDGNRLNSFLEVAWCRFEVKPYLEQQRRFLIAGDLAYPIREILIKPYVTAEAANDNRKKIV